MATFDVNQLNRRIREAQRRAEQEFKREVDRVNRANQKAVGDYNRKATAHNAKVIADYNRKVDAHNAKVVADYNASARDYNRRADAHNKQVIADLNRQLRSASSSIRY